MARRATSAVRERPFHQGLMFIAGRRAAEQHARNPRVRAGRLGALVTNIVTNPKAKPRTADGRRWAKAQAHHPAGSAHGGAGEITKGAPPCCG